MKDQRSYFEKADFQSDLPLQLLTAVLGLTLVLLELALAQWPIFYGSAPNLSLIFIYCMIIYHGKYMPIFTIFLMGIIGDFLLSDLLGGRATSYMLLTYLMQLRLVRLQQSDFGQLWFDFAVTCAAISLFQLLLFSAVNFAIPTLSPFLFQVGATLILFPIGFVLIFAVHRLLRKVKMV
ncbi:rod shape-determining protein MreD [Alphaproteobacteria bacterium]|jgi:rod shape-determining protein MreD|nr:rod shape-determining protein MreD [Alphaproteobacteria bacterium]